MFNKKEFDDIKAEMLSLRKSMDAHKTGLEEQALSMRQLHEKLAKMSDDTSQRFESLTDAEQERAQRIDSSVAEFDRLNDKYSGALESLKLIREGLGERLSKKIEEDFHSKIFEHTERMKTDAEKYAHLKTTLTGIANSLGALQQEIDKFCRIAQKISEKDFEVGSYIRHIEKEDKHKLELMREIDRLQSLVGKMRRHQ